MLPFPHIDPTAIEIGPLAIRWYALAYLAGIILGWKLAIRISRKYLPKLTETVWDDFVVWATVGIVLGGRLGYVIFYKPLYYLEHPLEALYLWHGGMSFHGGFLGVLFATYLFARKNKLAFWNMIDVAAIVTPIGLFFGRIANFINGELYGRTTDAPIGMVFPNGGDVPRHPSQLYEALGEGFLLFALLYYSAKKFDILKYPSMASGIFLAGYGLARFISEFFREPDAHLGFLFAGATMGQLLTLPMILFGFYLIQKSRRL